MEALEEKIESLKRERKKLLAEKEKNIEKIKKCDEKIAYFKDLYENYTIVAVLKNRDQKYQKTPIEKIREKVSELLSSEISPEQLQKAINIESSTKRHLIKKNHLIDGKIILIDDQLEKLYCFKGSEYLEEFVKEEAIDKPRPSVKRKSIKRRDRK